MNDSAPPPQDLQQIVVDLERKRSLLKTINDFALMLMGIPTREELVWYVAREVVGRLGFVDCVIYLIEPDRRVLRQQAAIGAKNPHSNQILNVLEIPVGQGITGHVAVTKTPMIVEDLSRDARYIPDVEPALSEICVPLVIDDEAVGVIDCEDPRRAQFDQEHLELLTTVAAMTSAQLKMINQTRRLQQRSDVLHRLNDRLRESEKRLTQATQLAKIGYYVRDTVEDRCLFCSDEHARIHDLTPAGYVARSSPLSGVLALVHPDDREAFEAGMQALHRGETFKMEYRVVTAGGEARCVRELAEPIFDVEGRVVQAIGTSQDVTEMKWAEDQLRHTYKMEAVGQLTGGVAHDFNNLLAVIRGNVEFLADRVGIEDRHVSTIMRASDMGAELTQRLLAFSRQQPLNAQSLDLAKLVADMSALLKRALGEAIAIETTARSDLWPAMADPGQVENALLNLAINARDAMPAGGELKIHCANAHFDGTPAGQALEALEGDYVMLAVSDIGSGMTAEVREHAFEPFFTTKEVGQGSGLGLSMVYGFAKQSGGHATIESREGDGTTVKLYLPRAEAQPEPAARPAAERIPRGHGERILVIEDDPSLRDLTAETLQSLGYEVIAKSEAASARAALENQGPVDLILSDVVLPGGTSGPELVEEIRRQRPDLAVIFMSGYAAEAAERKGSLGPDTVLLNKPFRRKQLAEALRDALS